MRVGAPLMRQRSPAMRRGSVVGEAPLPGVRARDRSCGPAACSRSRSGRGAGGCACRTSCPTCPAPPPQLVAVHGRFLLAVIPRIGHLPPPHPHPPPPRWRWRRAPRPLSGEPAKHEVGVNLDTSRGGPAPPPRPPPPPPGGARRVHRRRAALPPMRPCRPAADEPAQGSGGPAPPARAATARPRCPPRGCSPMWDRRGAACGVPRLPRRNIAGFAGGSMRWSAAMTDDGRTGTVTLTAQLGVRFTDAEWGSFTGAAPHRRAGHATV